MRRVWCHRERKLETRKKRDVVSCVVLSVGVSEWMKYHLFGGGGGGLWLRRMESGREVMDKRKERDRERVEGCVQ